MSLENVKVLLGVDNDKVSVIYNMYSQRLLRYLNQHIETEIIDVPEELEYILTELTILRYNRIGSEGMSQESMDGHSATYIDKDLMDYESIIQVYINKQIPELPRRGVVRFI